MPASCTDALGGSGWLLEVVEHSWRAREREEHRCRLLGRLPWYLPLYGWTWRSCVSVTTSPPHSCGQLSGCKTGVLRHLLGKHPGVGFPMRGTHEPQSQKPWHVSSSGFTWRTCVSCTHASLCFAARWMTSSGEWRRLSRRSVRNGPP